MDVAPEGFYLILTVFLGLCLGSFSTALSYRLPRGISILRKTRSSCPACGHDLSAVDLVPVLSWLFLGGKCRYCRVAVGRRYPVIELATLVLCLAFYGVYGFSPTTIAMFVLAPLCVSIIDIDFRYKIIPDGLNIAVLLTGVAALFAVSLQTGNAPDFLIEEGASAAGGLLIYGLGSLSLRQIAFMFLRREPMGLGDVKFFAAAGFWLGASFEAFAWFMMLSGMCGVVLALLWKKIKSETEVPFGPSLVFAFIILLLMRGAGFLTL